MLERRYQRLHLQGVEGFFYPDDVSPADMLAHYAGQLPAVEINNTFYRLPKQPVLESWCDQVPEGFRFAIKASRRITHLKRLKNANSEMEFLLGYLQAMGERLGAILFQLPPNAKADIPRLQAFLELLPRRARASQSWTEVFAFFKHESLGPRMARDLLAACGDAR